MGKQDAVPAHLLELPKRKQVPQGLHVVENLITGDESRQIVEWAQRSAASALSSGRASQWRPTSFGAVGTFKNNFNNLCGGILKETAKRIKDLGILDNPINFLQVNLYAPDQGIDTHADYKYEEVATVSCGGERVMDFYPYHGRPASEEQLQARVMLADRNVMFIKDDARVNFQHGIETGAGTKFKNKDISYDSVRVSLNFLHDPAIAV